MRIAHSHQSFMAETKKQTIERLISTPITKYCATHLFACGNDAAKWMWGKRAFERGDVYIMKNAIDAGRFEFSESKREELRKEFGLENKFVIGNVARFSYQKNHEFLVKIFAEVKKLRDDAVLMLVGRGELEDDVKKQVSELGLDDSVIFMGVRNDVPELLNAMDVFVLPSRFEGLGIVYIEAQMNGLKCFASEGLVPEEANVTGDMLFLPLKNENEWANKILDYSLNRCNVDFNKFEEYNIESAARKMQNKYFTMI